MKRSRDIRRGIHIRKAVLYLRQGVKANTRHLEIRLPVSGLERGPACHPERSEGSGSPDGEILRYAQDDDTRESQCSV